jgi:hypothetical protein
MAASCRTGRKDRAQLNDATLSRGPGPLCVSSCRLPTNQGPGLGSRLGFALDRVLLLEAIITGKPAQDPVLRPIL